MRTYELNKLSEDQLLEITRRPAQGNIDVQFSVREILTDIKLNGIEAVKKYSTKFENNDKLLASDEEFELAEDAVSESFKEALKQSAANITRFHSLQLPKGYEVETTPGVTCGRRFEPIEKVGLYIPGGSAPLVSTVLMLAIPAKLAGNPEVVFATPSKNGEVAPEILYAIKYLGFDKVYKTGGAQSIGLLTYIEKVNKVFGPGNQYVTEAKNQIDADEVNCSVDMPAGPSEVLVIADEEANPKFVAADLLSQLEHGTDSQAVLVTDSTKLQFNVLSEVSSQIKSLGRREILTQSVENLISVRAENLKQAVEFSNFYAPEHLIINTKNCESLLEFVKNAGSVFLGAYSPESAGDYSSGTNHTLPTAGYSKVYSGLSVDAFMRSYTYQKLSADGLKNLSDSIITLADTEGLDAHANAVRVRLENGN